MNRDTAYKSYRNYEKRVDKQVKDGSLARSQAHVFLKNARKNYRKNNHGKQMRKMGLKDA